MSSSQQVSIEFVGNAGGLMSAINSSVSAMGKMENQSKGLAASITSTIKSTLAPIALAVGSAFVAKKALQDFAESNLPGAAAFKKSIDTMHGSLKTLSVAIGEFLAPMAQRTNGWISAIANKIAPLIRILSAFIASSGAFFDKLSSNMLKAFKTLKLFPSVFAFFKSIGKLFGGGGSGLDKSIAAFRKSWNNNWNLIWSYTAPILVLISRLIETTIKAAGEIATVVMDRLRAAVQSVAKAFGIDMTAGVGAGMGSFEDWVAIVQWALITAITALDFAVKNWRLSFQIVGSFVELTVMQMQRYFMGFAVYAGDLFENIGSDIWTILKHYAGEVVTVFKAMWDNVGIIFQNFGGQIGGNWSTLKDNAISVFSFIGTEISSIFKQLGSNLVEIFKATFDVVGTNTLAFVIRIAEQFAKLSLQIAAALDPTGMVGKVLTGKDLLEHMMGGTIADKLAPFTAPDFSKVKGIGVGAMPGLAGLPGFGNLGAGMNALPGLAGLPALKGLPGAANVPKSKEEQELQGIYDLLKSTFGNGLAAEMEKAIKEANLKGPALFNQVKKGLPNVNAFVHPSVAGGAAQQPGIFQFGTAAAFQAERNATASAKELLHVNKQTHAEAVQARSERASDRARLLDDRMKRKVIKA